MLTPLRLMPVRVDRSKYLPPLLLELIEAAERGGDLVPAVQAIVRKLGFDGFMYATASYHLRPSNGERIYVFTTLPREWVRRYDQQAYVECDPRVFYSFESALPLVWDQASERGKNPRTDAFLKDAVAHGVGSGVAFPVYAGYPARTLVSLNSAEPLIDEARRAEIAASLGDNGPLRPVVPRDFRPRRDRKEASRRSSRARRSPAASANACRWRRTG